MQLGKCCAGTGRFPLQRATRYDARMHHERAASASLSRPGRARVLAVRNMARPRALAGASRTTTLIQPAWRDTGFSPRRLFCEVPTHYGYSHPQHDVLDTSDADG